MNFNKHSGNLGHAFLSPSKMSWINYTDEKLIESYTNFSKSALGIEMHAIAQRLITHAIRLPDTSASLNMFVNDAIGYRMSPEVVLFYSENAFGTADAISYYDPTKTLRIHDYKSGSTPGHPTQVNIYGALFCLEYRMNPSDIIMKFRIYQFDEVLEWSPQIEEIHRIMDVIVRYDILINEMKERGIRWPTIS